MDYKVEHLKNILIDESGHFFQGMSKNLEISFKSN